MANEENKQLQKEEVAVVKTIINIFSNNNFTYKQAMNLLPEVKSALQEISLNENVSKVNRHL